MTATDTGARFDFGRVTSRTTDLVGRNFVPFFVLSFIFAGAPYFVIQLLQPILQSDPTTGGGIVFVGILLMVMAGYVLQAALTRASIDDLSGKGVSIPAALSTGVALALPMLGLGILIGLAVGFGLMLLVVPGVYLALRWAVGAPVLVVEKTGVFQAMGRSAVLTENHRWGILGLFVIYLIIVIVLQIVVAAIIPGAMGAMAGVAQGGPPIVFVVIMTVVTAFTSMVGTVGLAAVYFELRQIKEGVDVTQLASVFE